MKKVAILLILVGHLAASNWCESSSAVSREQVLEIILKEADWTSALILVSDSCITKEMAAQFEMLASEARASNSVGEMRYVVGSQYIGCLCALDKDERKKPSIREFLLGWILFRAKFADLSQIYLDRAVMSHQLQSQQEWFAICISARVDLSLGKKQSAMLKIEKVLALSPTFPYALGLKRQMDGLDQGLPGMRADCLNDNLGDLALPWQKR